MTVVMEQRVSLITLAVNDLERAAGFYEALGWQRVKSEDGVVAFDLIGRLAVVLADGIGFAIQGLEDARSKALLELVN